MDHPVTPNSPAQDILQQEQVAISPPERRSTARIVFYGSNGLRAGWRMLIFILLFAMLNVVGREIRRAIRGPAPVTVSASRGVERPQRAIGLEVSIFAMLLLASWVMSNFEKRPLRWYGIGAREAFGSKFWEGGLWGLGALTLLLLLMRASGAYYFGEVSTRGGELLKFGLLWGIAFVLVGFTEEYLFRGYLQYTLTTGIGFWGAAAVLSAAFAFAHTGNPGETWIGVLDLFLGAFALSLMLRRTGNLWFPIGFHAGWDWAQSFVYGVADSGVKAAGTWLNPYIPQNKPWWLTGGSVGPEGSILSCLIEVVVVLLILRRFKQAPYPEGIIPTDIAPATVQKS